MRILVVIKTQTTCFYLVSSLRYIFIIRLLYADDVVENFSNFPLKSPLTFIEGQDGRYTSIYGRLHGQNERFSQVSVTMAAYASALYAKMWNSHKEFW